jgi:hypothetical protein
MREKNVSPGVFIAIIAVVLVVVGVVAYRTFFTDPNYTPIKGAAAEKAYDEGRARDREMYTRMLREKGKLRPGNSGVISGTSSGTNP